MNKGYFFDFSVYTTIKVIQEKMFFPEYHVDRLFQSAQIIELEHGFSKTEVLGWLKLVVEKNKTKDAVLRIILIGDAEKNKNAKLYIFPVTGLTYYPDYFYKKGVKAITYRGERRIPRAKTKDMFLSFLAYREARKRGAIDALLIDGENNIREGTQSNFFAIKGDILIAPPKEKVLEGITKKIVLEVSASHFEIKEEDVPFSGLETYDEFFITSTTKNIMSLNQIDEIKFSSNFEKTRLIQKLFKDYCHKYVLGEKK